MALPSHHNRLRLLPWKALTARYIACHIACRSALSAVRKRQKCSSARNPSALSNLVLSFFLFLFYAVFAVFSRNLGEYALHGFSALPAFSAGLGSQHRLRDSQQVDRRVEHTGVGGTHSKRQKGVWRWPSNADMDQYRLTKGRIIVLQLLGAVSNTDL